MKWLCSAIVLAVACWTAPVQAGEIAVAAASDLIAAFREATAQFERQTGTRVKLSLGSSGNFYSQILNGAPFDLYFSADIGYPEKLAEAGLTVPGSLYRYAVGRLVLWAPRGSAMDVRKGLDGLPDQAVRKIAIANPRHAPYGRAAVAALQHAGIYDAVTAKLVLGENVSQAAQFAESGAADAGLIALSLAMTPAMRRAGQYREIPQEMHPPIVQGAVVLKNGTNREGAQAFVSFLQQREGREILRRHGFAVPEAVRP
jgi:molybdate transport system substrate-binding protein